MAWYRFKPISDALRRLSKECIIPCHARAAMTHPPPFKARQDSERKRRRSEGEDTEPTGTAQVGNAFEEVERLKLRGI